MQFQTTSGGGLAQCTLDAHQSECTLGVNVPNRIRCASNSFPSASVNRPLYSSWAHFPSSRASCAWYCSSIFSRAATITTKLAFTPLTHLWCTSQQLSQSLITWSTGTWMFCWISIWEILLFLENTEKNFHSDLEVAIHVWFLDRIGNCNTCPL